MNTSIGSHTSPGNQTDYCIYTCVDSGMLTRLVAIIDAKHRLGVHGTAQLIGYYSAATTKSPPPVAVLISSLQIQFVCFFSIGMGWWLISECSRFITHWHLGGHRCSGGLVLVDLSVLKLFIGILHKDSIVQKHGTKWSDASTAFTMSRIKEICQTEKEKNEEIQEQLQCQKATSKQLQCWLKEHQDQYDN